MSIKLVADTCSGTDRTLSNWIRIVDECRFKVLRPRKQPDYPQSLNKTQKILKLLFLLSLKLSGMLSGMD